MHQRPPVQILGEWGTRSLRFTPVMTKFDVRQNGKELTKLQPRPKQHVTKSWVAIHNVRNTVATYFNDMQNITRNIIKTDA